MKPKSMLAPNRLAPSINSYWGKIPELPDSPALIQ